MRPPGWSSCRGCCIRTSTCSRFSWEFSLSESGPLSNVDHLAAGQTGAIEDQARSVHSPAAYLADLLQLVEDRFERAALLEARRRIKDIPLDAANTFTEVPYLDVVNEVLAENVAVKQGEDAYTTMTGMTALSSPVAMPFSLADLRRRKYLRLAGVAPGAALPAVHARTRSGRRRSRVPGAVAGDRRPGHDGGRGGGRRQGPLPARRGRVLHAQAGRALPGGERPLGPRAGGAALRQAERPGRRRPGPVRAGHGVGLLR